MMGPGWPGDGDPSTCPTILAGNPLVGCLTFPRQTAFPRRLRRNVCAVVPWGPQNSVPLQEIPTIFMPLVGGIKAGVPGTGSI